MEKQFEEVVQSTMQKYDETLRKLAAGEVPKTELIKQDHEGLSEIETNGSSDLPKVGNKQ